MDRDTEVTLGQVYDGIVAAISGEFAGLHVEAEREDRKPPLPLPACLVELSELVGAPDHDPGTEQLAMLASFEAHLLVGFRQSEGKSAKREAAELAGAVAAFARLNRWGCPIGPAEVMGAYRDDFTSDQDQYEAWKCSGFTPSVIMGSWAPLIGVPHEPDYVRLNEAPPTDTLNETGVVLL
jgi:hypothetical protein